LYNLRIGATSSTQTATAARAHFDRWARVYGRSRVLGRLQDRALSSLELQADDRLLDVACGAGALVREVAPRVERAVGADISPGMLELARSRMTSAEPGELTNVELIVAPSDALPFEDGSFSALVCTTALHHFPDPQGSIDEMARVLAPDGRIVIGDMCRDLISTKLIDPVWRRVEAGHVGLQRMRDMEAMLTRAGLHVTSARHIWLRTYALLSAERRT
jgi:ubiquinone/menaquinone biosynthesis C-methylase UbiE